MASDPSDKETENTQDRHDGGDGVAPAPQPPSAKILKRSEVPDGGEKKLVLVDIGPDGPPRKQ